MLRLFRFLLLLSFLLYLPTGVRQCAAPVDVQPTARLEILAEEEMVAITVDVPAGATLTIPFPHQDDYIYTNDGTETMARKVRIPWAVYYPNAPLEETRQVITPTVTVTTKDGRIRAIDCPPFMLTFAALRIEFLTDGITEDGVFTVTANADGTKELWGAVKSVAACNAARVTVNGEPVILYEGCIFIADLTVIDDAPTTYEIAAEMDNFRTVRTTVTVLPYEGTHGAYFLTEVAEYDTLRTTEKGEKR